MLVYLALDRARQQRGIILERCVAKETLKRNEKAEQEAFGATEKAASEKVEPNKDRQG